MMIGLCNTFFHSLATYEERFFPFNFITWGYTKVRVEDKEAPQALQIDLA